jgi:hypothetical protein
MQKIFIRELYKILSLLTPAIAILLSMVVLLSEFKDFKIFPISITIFASILGATTVFIFARLRAISSAPTVFISYTSHDKEFAMKVAQVLESIPVKVLIDEHELNVGDNVKQKVSILIENADYFVFVISKNTIKSEWARKELLDAMKKKKKILPLLLDKEAIPKELEDIVYADFTESFEKGIQQLRKSFAR